MAQQSTLKQEMQNRSNGTTAVATQQQPEHKTLAHLLTDPKIKAQMALALPKHMTADRLARIALTEIRKNPKLAQCDQHSFLGAIMQLASLGLEPGGALGHAYLIPFDKSVKDGNQWVKRTEVQVVIGYRGMIDLARRSGQIVSISSRVVHANDKFSYTYGLDETLEHEPYEGGGDPGEVTHAYAVAKLVGGGVQFEVMPVAQILRVRDASQGYKAAVASAEKYKKDVVDSPWTNHFEEMCRKTPTRNLFKWLPVSIEMQRAVGLDEQADAGLSQHNSLVIDGDYRIETHDEPGAGDGSGGDAPQFTVQEVHDAIANAASQDKLDEALDLVRTLPKKEQQPLIDLGKVAAGKFSE